MKKVLLLTLVLSMLVSCFAVAAPSVDYIFSVTENGNVYYYMFGRTETTTTDVGVSINGKDYNLDENALTKAQKSGRFGIGIADPDNILGESFSATPYEVVNGEKQTGEEKSIVKTNVADNDVIALNSLTINGKAVAGFYTGTTETDFYYGLDEITSISDIPEVSYALNIGNATTSLSEETGGYVYKISATYTGRDGVVKTTEFKVHFREFAEVTKTVYPGYAYQVQHSYIGAFNNLSEVTVGYNKALTVRAIPDIYSSNNSYLQYITYNVPAHEGYAPVYYDLNDIWLGNSGASEGDSFPVSAYSYDGSLKVENLPDSSSYADSEIFDGFEGFNSSSEFLLREFTEVALKYNGNVFSSTSVKEGANIIIWKSNDVTTDADGKAANSYRINYHTGYSADGVSWKMPITVKYVEKNPKDVTDVDTTISSLTIKGNTADAVKDNTYYVAVNDISTNDGISSSDIIATPTINGASCTVSEITDNQATVTVIAKDGETTENYTIKFKQITSGSAQISSQTRLTYNETSYTTIIRTNKGYMYVSLSSAPLKTSGNYIEYIDFKLSDLDNIVVVGDMTVSGTAEYTSGYAFYSTQVETVTTSCTFDEFLEGGSANLLGRGDYKGSNSVSITFDSKNVNVRDNKNVMLVLIDDTVDSSAKLLNPALTFNYITLE